MSNHLPPGAIPKLFRQKDKNGNEVGSFYINIAKKPVNLRTSDYMKARERAREAYHDGKRDFIKDDVKPTLALGPISETAAETIKNVTDDWVADVTAAASQSASSITPEVFPPSAPPPDMPSVSATQPTQEKTDAPKSGDSTRISPQMIEGIIKQAAQVVVELQIVGQEFLWKRWGKLQPGTVPEDHDCRKIPQELWEQAIREWIPTDVPLPPWLLAPIVCAALTVPVQLEGAKPLPTEPVTPKTE